MPGVESEPLLPADGVRDRRSAERFGYALLLLSALFFCAMVFVVRFITGYREFSFASMTVIRGALQTAFTLAVGALAGWHTLKVPRRLLALVVLRGLVGGMCISVGYLAITRLPLGVSTSIFFVYPVITMALSYVLLGEHVSVNEAVASLVSLCGVVLVSNPGLQLPLGLSHTNLLGCLLSMTSATLCALETICIRALSKHVHYLTNVLAMGVGIFVCGIVAGGGAVPELRTDPVGVMLAVLASVLGIIGQMFLNRGFQSCRAGTGTVLRSVDVPLAYIGGVLLGEVPQSISVLGSAIVVCATTYVGIYSVRRSEACGEPALKT